MDRLSGLWPLAMTPSTPRHGRPCAGHPDSVKRRTSPIGITGTSPVMTRWGMTLSWVTVPDHALLGRLTHHTLPRHGRACPGHPDRKSAALHRIGITGTRPVITGEAS
ncbi:hypothetical protein J4G37_00010 [Microvirga sp. 3-52]|nr:hypothetical protein [Microvirga sp. 3-52]